MVREDEGVPSDGFSLTVEFKRKRKTEITAMVRPKGKVVERNFFIIVLNGILKGEKLYCCHVLGATISFDKFTQMVKNKLRFMGLSAEISLEFFWGNDRIQCELDFFEMWIFGVEDKGGFVTLHVDIIGGGGVDMDTGDGVSRRGISIKNLDDSVLENILFRLPLGTPSSQAKRVCKLWKSILYNRRHNEVGYLFACRDYKDDYYKHNKMQLYFGEKYDHIDCNTMSYYYSHEKLMEMEHCRFAFKSYPRRNILVGSCNGLVCFQKGDAGSIFLNLQEPFAICNPLMGEFISLRRDLSKDVDSRTLVVTSGFGYCHLSGEYKVVRLYSINGDERRASYAQVYTIGSNKWRDMEKFIDGTLFYDSGPGIFANGFLHWLGNKQEAGRIVAFDLEDEKFGELPLPIPEADYSDVENELKLLGGNLCWFMRTSSRLDIWSYKKNILNAKSTSYGTEEYDQKCSYYDNNSWNWVKEFSIGGLYDQPFAITKSNQVLMIGVRYISCYDPETRTTVISQWNDRLYMDQVIPHANSYVSLKDFGETWYGPGCSVIPSSDKHPLEIL